MKRKLLIISGIILIFIILGVWAYILLFSGTGQTGGVFSRFGASDVSVNSSGEDVSTSIPRDTASQSPEALQKITGRPVLAATIIDGAVRYVEQGTGHIYEYTFGSGDEVKISNTTIPRASSAMFSPDGTRVAIATGGGGTQNTVVGEITTNASGEGVVDGISLPDDALDVAFSDSGDAVFYRVEIETGSVGYQYDVDAQTQKELFSIPLKQIYVLWGDDTLVYTKPSGTQFGYLYEVINDSLQFVMPKRAGLLAKHPGSHLIINSYENEAFAAHTLADGLLERLPLRVLAEKCVATGAATSTLYCAGTQTIPFGLYPDDWYKGVVSFTDSLWKIDWETKAPQLVADISTLAKEPLDVVGPQINSSETIVSFINKNDGSLWVYKLKE